MRTKTTSVVTLKSGETILEGVECEVTVPNRSNPTLAQVDVLGEDGKVTRSFKTLSAYLWKRFDGFQEFTREDLEGAVMDSTCPSLTGDTVEPDGWDSEGFPSILLACGIM